MDKEIKKKPKEKKNRKENNTKGIYERPKGITEEITINAWIQIKRRDQNQ